MGAMGRTASNACGSMIGVTINQPKPVEQTPRFFWDADGSSIIRQMTYAKRSSAIRGQLEYWGIARAQGHGFAVVADKGARCSRATEGLHFADQTGSAPAGAISVRREVKAWGMAAPYRRRASAESAAPGLRALRISARWLRSI